MTLLGNDKISGEAHPNEHEFSASGRALNRWFDKHARDLPWRRLHRYPAENLIAAHPMGNPSWMPREAEGPDAYGGGVGTRGPDNTARRQLDPMGPWGVLVSEVMLQQTQVERVRPVWEEWIRRWPEPSALAEEPLAEALRAWGRLGYPRRAARLHEAARVIVAEHGGRVPDRLDALLALPGVGAYTARAVLAFAFGQRSPVVDVNVRRVLRRVWHGEADGPARAADLPETLALLPDDPGEASKLSAALMELGQIVCAPESPNCDVCPISPCRWARAGKPAAQAPAGRRAPRYAGSDRQARGAILAALRESADPLRKAVLDQVWLANPAQRERAIASLVDDGLIHVDDEERVALGPAERR